MPIITLDLPVDGESANAQSIIDPLTTVLNLLNGNLDSDNIDNFDGDKINENTLSLNSLDATGRKGWITGATPPSSVSYLGNRSYQLTYASSIAGYKTIGMRNRFTRSTSAPTQCTSLNGSSQYWVKSSPNKLAFTDDFVAMGWIKISSYAVGTIVSRYNGTSGWALKVESDGRITLIGYNAGSGNYSYVRSYESIPLDRWVHVAAQLDMSSYTATTTTSYVMIDGIDRAAAVGRAGTNPTALVQAGDLEIGSLNGGTSKFTGKIAQVAVFNAKVTQATIIGYISQGLSGSETALASAYSFSNSATDLNTTTPNDLSVGGGSATATNADSPFGGQADGTISANTEYGVTMSISSDGLTEVVQVPEGNAIPTSGGISALAYSLFDTPYNFPRAESKWVVEAKIVAQAAQAMASSTWYNLAGLKLSVPIGPGYLNALVNLYSNAACTMLQRLGTTAAAASTESELGCRDTDAGGAFHAKYTLNDYYLIPSVATPYYYNIFSTSTPTSQIGGEGIARLWWVPAVL